MILKYYIFYINHSLSTESLSELVHDPHFIRFYNISTMVPVPQKFQYQPNLGPVSKYRHPKYGTCCFMSGCISLKNPGMFLGDT